MAQKLLFKNPVRVIGPKRIDAPNAGRVSDASVHAGSQDYLEELKIEQERQRFKRIVTFGLLWTVSILFLLVGYALESVHETPRDPDLRHMLEVGATLFTEGGIAGIVAFFLAQTVERLSTEEAQKLAIKEREDLKKEVFYYAYGYGIPQAIKQQIDAQILRSSFIRNSMSLAYELSSFAPGAVPDGFVLVRLRMRYTVENITSTPQKFHVRAGIEPAAVRELELYHRFDKAEVELLGRVEQYNHFQLHAPERYTSDDGGCALDLGKYLIPPQGKATIYVEMQSTEYVKGGDRYFSFTTHTCKLDLSVLDRTGRLSVAARRIGQDPLVEAIDHSPGLGWNHWSSDSPFLAHQVVKIRWTDWDRAK